MQNHQSARAGTRCEITIIDGNRVVALDDEPRGGGEPGRVRQVVGAEFGQGVPFEVVGVFGTDRKVDLAQELYRYSRIRLAETK